MKTVLSDEIFNKLKNDILKGVYPTGKKIPSERMLSLRYNVSRVTIREATGKLAQIGLVKKIPQSGTYVCDIRSEGSLNLLTQIIKTTDFIDSDMLISLLEFLRLGEVFAIQKAIKNITPEHIAELKRILRVKKRHLHDPSTLSECDFLIHNTIVHLCENLFIELIFNSFRDLYEYYTVFYYSLEGTADRTLQFHIRLISALEKKDSNYAVYVIEQSLVYAENRIKDALDINESSRLLNMKTIMQNVKTSPG